MEITLNGKSVPVQGEATVLEVARREGIWIPTLCHHPGLPPYGACRLCIVEVKAGGRQGLTASCTLPPAEGLVVETDSPRVRERRKVLVQLLLAVVRDAPEIRELARRLGVEKAPFKPPEEKRECILCGLCVRVCETAGNSAIGFAFRGSQRRVSPPFGKAAADCIGCRACAKVCPTGAVRFEQAGDRLTGEPWQADLQVARCTSCGRPLAARLLLDFARKKVVCSDFEGLCPACRRRKVARSVKRRG
ncbi:MAG TPA: 4Fe-4S dicluster domain-containing protein [Syntrophomonadaceae bacterium]|nr:4Fe-4S dicluster domain-containing protein [Syntrophomonadaceae bacterium]